VTNLDLHQQKRDQHVVPKEVSVMSSPHHCALCTNKPVGHNVALEAQFCLEEAVECLRVLRRIGVIETIVGAHHGGCTSLDRILEWPQVELESYQYQSSEDM
jgi:hypothetical protein